MYVAMRIVEAREHAAAWQIIAISGVSIADAIRLRERLGLALQLEDPPQGESALAAEIKSSAEKEAAGTVPDSARVKAWLEEIKREARDDADKSLEEFRRKIEEGEPPR